MPLASIRRSFFAAVALVAVTSAAHADYTIQETGSLGRNSTLTSVNNNGVAAGWAFVNDSLTHAFRWSNGNLTDIGTLGGNSSYAYGINDNGIIVGQSNASQGGPLRPVKYENGAWTDLGTLGGPTGAAFGINNLDEIVGQTDKSGGLVTTHGFFWKNGVMSDLVTLGGQFSTAFAVNSNSRAAGVAALSGFNGNHAATWLNSVVTDLGTLGGSFGAAKAINDRGDVVGYASASGVSPTRAFLRLNGGAANLPLGALGGPTLNSQALGINHNGVIVGWSEATGDTVHHAFVIFGVGNTMLDLNTLLPPASGWKLLEATAVNEAGVIVGNGQHLGGVRGFYMVPVGTLGVEIHESDALAFSGAFPNPAAGRTQFAFTMPAPGHARLALYDLSGRLVRTLAEGSMGSGRQVAAWDGLDAQGKAAGMGLYFARLEAAGHVVTRRVSVMR